METKTRCLGKLEHHGEFDPEEEHDGMNVYKGLDVYVPPINDKEPETKEEYYEKIVLKFDIISDERSELVRTLRNGVKKFKDDRIMIDFCKQYGELFNDNEFNLCEYSKDDDSEGEPDGDNENNNHDDDGAPTTDANKQNEKESGSEGTEENGSEGTKGGSDGKEEKMNGDDREVTVQMDIDNQNEELNKEKDANETEDNDNMNNNEMKNDLVQEKQDADKDENAEKEKVETEKEKQDKANKVDNVQEKQDDDKEKLSQAKEEIKKKKTAKSKTVIEMNPPSFSLGLSSDTNKVEERAAKSTKKPSRFIVSPYINKKTATKGKAVQDEMMITNYLFLMKGNEFDFIFETKEGNATIRDYMQTLAPTLKIESNVINTYYLVLNHEQGMNSKGKKTKYFFHTRMITKDMFKWKKEDGKKYDEVKQYKAFSDTMKNEFKKDGELKKMKDLEMGTTMITDNSKMPMAYEAKYKENYNGENARNWNLKFLTEEKGNKYDIIKMRMRFAAKMLTHEINIHRENISKEALEFADRNKEKKAREALLLKAIREKKQKQDSERVSSAI
ncbi:hypothetical protein Tco_1505296 [Tanacetum coccineum]